MKPSLEALPAVPLRCAISAFIGQGKGNAGGVVFGPFAGASEVRSTRAVAVALRCGWPNKQRLGPCIRTDGGQDGDLPEC